MRRSLSDLPKRPNYARPIISYFSAHGRAIEWHSNDAGLANQNSVQDEDTFPASTTVLYCELRVRLEVSTSPA